MVAIHHHSRCLSLPPSATAPSPHNTREDDVAEKERRHLTRRGLLLLAGRNVDFCSSSSTTTSRGEKKKGKDGERTLMAVTCRHTPPRAPHDTLLLC